MNTRFTLGLAVLAALASTNPTRAQVPGIILYQGHITSNGTNFTGLGQFRFTLVRPGIFTTTLWSQDGNTPPGSIVSVPVTNGLFTVALGDTSLAGMVNPIPPEVFDNSTVRLRIWFNDGASGFAQLEPDQRLTSVGYAMRAANVVDGAITSEQIAPGSITGTNIAANSLTSSDIADILTLQTLNLGGLSWDGTLNLFARPTGGGGIVGPNGEPRGILAGDDLGSELALYFSDGATGTSLSSRSTGGRLQLRDSTGNDTTVDLSAGGAAGGFLTLRNPSGLTRAFLQGGGTHDGGELQLRDSTGANRLRLYGNAPGYIIDTPSAGGVDLFDLNGNRRIAMRGGDGTIHLPQENGQEGVFLAGGSLGGLGGVVRVRQGNGGLGAVLAGQDGAGGSLFTLYNGLGDVTVSLDADASGRGSLFSLFNGTNTTSVFLDGNSGGAGLIEVKNNQGVTRARLDGQGVSGGGELALFDASTTPTVNLRAAETATTGARLEMHQGNGARTVVLDAEGSTGGGFFELYKSDGTRTVWVDADAAGEGKISTQVLEITGGSDFSENFNIASPDARSGMLVKIDAAHPGELVVSDRAYDRAVAGVVSGAGGVKPGVRMGQRGTAADGQHPVALTGRVYCLVDADQGAVVPGDLITTSDTPGHGMKVVDHPRAQGAIIGKAMTGLESGRGLVLVLVSLQ